SCADRGRRTMADGIDRRTLLRGVGTAVMVPALLGHATATADPGLTPFDLHFEIAHRYRPFDLVAPRFTQYDRPASPASDTLVSTGVRPRAPFGSVLVDVLGG